MKWLTQLTTWLASRSRRDKVRCVVLHATAGSTLAGAISTLRLKGFSYHYIIEDARNGRDGLVTKCVPTSREAFHAGRSVGPLGSNVNTYSIGVCMVNLNNGKDPYSDAQFESARKLLLELKAANPGLTWLTTHYAITVQPDGRARKTDPRALQDFEALAESVGLTPWKPSYAKRYVAPA